jgi:hypothetical protein
VYIAHIYINMCMSASDHHQPRFGNEIRRTNVYIKYKSDMSRSRRKNSTVGVKIGTKIAERRGRGRVSTYIVLAHNNARKTSVEEVEKTVVFFFFLILE